MTDNELDAIDTRRRLARDEVVAICKGKQWRMCIPVEQTDSDICITNSLDDINALVSEVRRLKSSAERVAYDPAIHGEGIDADEGEEIWWIETAKWPAESVEIERLRAEISELLAIADAQSFQLSNARADIERIGRERDQMVAANVELQERLSRLEDDGR